MKLKDLIESGLVKDEDTLNIRMKGMLAKTVQRGNWFQDHILNSLELYIQHFTWWELGSWDIWVSAHKEADNEEGAE